MHNKVDRNEDSLAASCVHTTNAKAARPGTQRQAETGRHAKAAGRDRPVNAKAAGCGHAAHAKEARGVRSGTQKQPVEIGFD